MSISSNWCWAWIAVVGIMAGCHADENVQKKTVVEVVDLAGLVSAAAGDDQVIHMRPGNYPLSGLVSDASIEAMRKAGNHVLMSFPGNRNRFELSGVVIEWQTEFREKLKPPVHTNDIEITGADNIIRGLEIRCTGDGTSPGGALLSIQGTGNMLQDCRFLVRGSFPYGYGDVFGKGGGPVIGHRKHSGIQIAGSGTKLTGCELRMRSFGHGYYIQKNAGDILLENCSVEGVVRPTEEMLTETTGPAFEKDFRTVFRNHEGRETLLPGYAKSLSEDGFRTYDQNTNVVMRNCTARNMRGGFELRTKQGTRLVNCAALGCERGFWVADGAVLDHCRGDAKNGPLLFLEGHGTKIDLAVLPDQSDRTVHSLAIIRGRGHQVALRPEGGERADPLPIRIGFGPPPAGEGMAPFREDQAAEVTLRNTTKMPVLLGARSERCQVGSLGAVPENRGKENTVVDLKP
ncbi:MAG: right-handed parallel beta-helix repeat-containing protein [Verrucomicrobiae bacterium]|nr:right-handed parallel beta-helix repeat-containing protein [Verrucomicrobiae bacterium]